MREIRFRAWDTQTKSYIEHGFDFRLDGDGYIYWRIWGESAWQRTSNLILEQSTGLKDKNGKEIYEGDIIETSAGSIYLVFWVNTGWNPFVDHCIKPRRIERIIGDIHTTPELLEKPK